MERIKYYLVARYDKMFSVTVGSPSPWVSGNPVLHVMPTRDVMWVDRPRRLPPVKTPPLFHWRTTKWAKKFGSSDNLERSCMTSVFKTHPLGTENPAHIFSGVGRIPFSKYSPSGVIRIGLPVWKWKSWKILETKVASGDIYGPDWKGQALKALYLIQFKSWVNSLFPLLAL